VEPLILGAVQEFLLDRRSSPEEVAEIGPVGYETEAPACEATISGIRRSSVALAEFPVESLRFRLGSKAFAVGWVA
jgi:hypothetical protein